MKASRYNQGGYSQSGGRLQETPMIVALALLMLSDAGILPPSAYRAWQWQRAVEPAAISPVAEQCVVLDAMLYTVAAPGLRDVRLLQSGRQIAYVVQESYDEGALDRSGLPNRSDRSLYTTVLRIPLTPLSSPHPGGTTRPQTGSGLLPQRVPVERMELVPKSTPEAAEIPGSLRSRIHLRLVATPGHFPISRPAQRDDSGEVIQADLPADDPVETTALGANLQTEARIAVNVEGNRQFSEMLLQMHQRSICFQPLSRAPLLLLTGNPDARPVHYDYSVHYRPTATPLLAAMGPLLRNPVYNPKLATGRFLMTRMQRLSLAAGIALTGFLLTVGLLLRRR